MQFSNRRKRRSQRVYFPGTFCIPPPLDERFQIYPLQSMQSALRFLRCRLSKDQKLSRCSHAPVGPSASSKSRILDGTQRRGYSACAFMRWLMLVKPGFPAIRRRKCSFGPLFGQAFFCSLRDEDPATRPRSLPERWDATPRRCVPAQVKTLGRRENE